MKKGKILGLGVIATAMFAGAVSSINVPFANIVYAETAEKTTGTASNTSATTEKKAKTKKIKIENKNVSVPTTGNKWVKSNGYYHFVKDGELVKGWKAFTKADGESVAHFSYFDDKGRLYTGWHKMGEAEGEKEEHYSYFGADGWLRTGWQKMGTKNNPDGSSKEHYSYFGYDGWLQTGWKHFTKADGESTDHYSYFGKNGWLQTEWKHFTKADGETKDHWSYFAVNGWLQISKWYKDGNGDHYFDNKGWMATGNNIIDNKLYNEAQIKGISGVLKRNTSVNNWYKCNDKWYFLQKGEVLTAFNGVSQVNQQGTWYNIKNGATDGPVQGTCILAHAAKDEREEFMYGKAGDQTKSEAYFRTWYNRPWQYVLRPKDKNMQERLAVAMTRAAYNEHIGYDMSQRNTLYMEAAKVGWDPGKVTKDVETDCSALVSVALLYAGLKTSDVRVNNNSLYTYIMKDKLMATGKFTLYTSKEYIASPNKLQRGDILILPNGHTAVCVKSVSDLKNNK